MSDESNNVMRVPLHVQIADRLREEVRRQRKPGDKFGSQNELARRFGVSAITIREAVGALVQEGLLERRHGSGTYVCDSGAIKAIGVLIEQDISCPETSYYWIRLTQQLRRQFGELGYDTRLYAGHTRSGDPEPDRPTCAEFWRDLKGDKIRALAIVGTPLRQTWVKELQERKIAMVSTNMPEIGPASSTDMIREGTRYLIEHGRRRIAVLTWGTPEHPNKDYEAFRSEMVARKVPVHERWVHHAGISPYDSFAGLEGFRKIWQASDTKPDGLLICNDRLLYSALSAVRLMNVDVPNKLMIVGHTHRGELNGEFPFPIVRMEVDPDQHAKRLGDALLQLMDGKPIMFDPDFKPYRLVDPSNEAMSTVIT